MWPLIFGAGTIGGSGVAFFLPEKLWSNAHTMVIYKKGDEKDDKTFLKIGEDKKSDFYIPGTENSESLIRLKDGKIEHQSMNWEKTRNNSLWLAGDKYLKESNNWQRGLNKKIEIENPEGSLSLYFLNINCDNLIKNEQIKNNLIDIKTKIDCISKVKK